MEGPPLRAGLIRGPIHTDLLLPLTPDLRESLAFAAKAGVPLDDPRAEWLVVGWGSRAFYTATGSYADLRLATVWQAATGDSAVLRLDVAGPVPPDAPGVDWITLSSSQQAALSGAILATFADPTALPDAGFTATDAFFPARGRFHLFNTCNVWIARTLRAAGHPFGIWTPTPFAVRLSLWRFAG
jgi:uncharacterized protein (TIGR02117 family)